MKSRKRKNIPIVKAVSSYKPTIVDKSARAEPFRTRTIITEEEGKKVVYKCPASEMAKEFVKGIVAKEKANAAYLKGHFDVHCGTLEKDCIQYDYLPYPSLPDKMQSHMHDRDFQAADELFYQYIQRIEALETTYTLPKEFLTLVADKDDYASNVKCLSRGLFDLTPKNILLHGNRWILLDNEWSFNFPIPMIFVVFRGIWELVGTLQGEIRKITSEDIPALGIFASALHTYYVPLIWIKYIIATDTSLRRLIKWEAGFREYTFAARAYVGRIKRWPSLRRHFSARSIKSDNQVYIRMKKSIKSLPGVAKLEHILDE